MRESQQLSALDFQAQLNAARMSFLVLNVTSKRLCPSFSSPLNCSIYNVPKRTLYSTNSSSLRLRLRSYGLSRRVSSRTVSYDAKPTSTSLIPNVQEQPNIPGPPNPTPETWVDRLPEKVRPYLYLTRIDKPIGTLLLFYPCGTSPPSLKALFFNSC